MKGCVYGLIKGIESGKGLFVTYNGRGCLAALFLCYAACKNTISLSKTVCYGAGDWKYDDAGGNQKSDNDSNDKSFHNNHVNYPE